MGFARLFSLGATLTALFVACGGTSTTPVTSEDDAGSHGGGTDAGTGGTGTEDGSVATTDAGSGGGFDAAPDPADGAPTRKACTNAFGNAVTTFHGRLDGYLVAIVPTTQHTCNGDSTHVHLQVLMSGSVYDVAVNVDGLEANLPHAMIGGPWSEGWHTTSESLDYPTALGIHSPSFATTNAQALIASLANANHISVFATGYGPTGMHLVHRKGNGNDGAIIVNPLGGTPQFFVFRFATDSF